MPRQKQAEAAETKRQKAEAQVEKAKAEAQVEKAKAEALAITEKAQAEAERIKKIADAEAKQAKAAEAKRQKAEAQVEKAKAEALAITEKAQAEAERIKKIADAEAKQAKAAEAKRQKAEAQVEKARTEAERTRTEAINQTKVAQQERAKADAAEAQVEKAKAEALAITEKAQAEASKAQEDQPKAEDKGRLQCYQKKSDPKTKRCVITYKDGRRQAYEVDLAFISEEAIEVQDSGNYETTKDSHGLPGTQEEVKPSSASSCFHINDKDTQTEACHTNCGADQGDIVSSKILQNKKNADSIEDLLIKVDKRVEYKRRKNFPSFHEVKKICAPSAKNHLEAIIANFNKNCSPRSFGEFFNKVYCKSCSRGIPPEIMMSMMSLESSGNCKAENWSATERSTGPFQMNSSVHQCSGPNGKKYKLGSNKNAQCFMNPSNALHHSLNKTEDYYNKLNNPPLDKSSCKKWQDMTVPERDSWRRTVSGYNSGLTWVLRAIKSIQDRRTLTDTGFLAREHSKGKYDSSLKHSKVSWEKLRLYYFIEKFSPGNKIGTGRKLENTFSNLAHTETALGREGGKSLSVADLWGQYVEQKKPRSCPKPPSTQ